MHSGQIGTIQQIPHNGTQHLFMALIMLNILKKKSEKKTWQDNSSVSTIDRRAREQSHICETDTHTQTHTHTPKHTGSGKFIRPKSASRETKY